MSAEQIDCLIIYGSSSLDGQMASLRYMTNIGFAEGYLVFPIEGEPTLFVFIGRRGRGKWADQWITDVRSGHPDYARAICDRIKEIGVDKRTIGVVSSDEFYRGFGFPYSVYNEIVSGLPEASFVDSSNMIEGARLIKGRAEIGCIEKAAEIGLQIMDLLKTNAKPGADHMMIRRRAFETLLELGGEKWNPFLYSFGENMTHAGVKNMILSSPAIVKQNEIILTEFGVEYRGYTAQYNQPYSVGEPDGEWQRVFEACLKGYQHGFKALRPGMTAGELEDIVLSPIRESGYVFENPPFHGLGLSLEQPIGIFPAQPSHVPKKSFVFKENMILELEPAAMTSDLNIGMSLGDTLVVTDSGCRRLSKESEPEFIRTN